VILKQNKKNGLQELKIFGLKKSNIVTLRTARDHSIYTIYRVWDPLSGKNLGTKAFWIFWSSPQPTSTSKQNFSAFSPLYNASFTLLWHLYPPV
jgi:hypothetical protein